jgi:hypothetical protein
MFFSRVEGVQVRQSLVKVHPIYGSVCILVFSMTPQDPTLQPLLNPTSR